LTPPWWFTILQGAHRRGGGLHVACAATSPRACASESDAARQQGYVEGHVLVPLDTCRHLTNAWASRWWRLHLWCALSPV